MSQPKEVVPVKPLAIDLFCGLGGWAEGFLSEGYQVIGFDIERRPYPGQLVLQDVLTLHGSQFRRAAAIVGSSPCQEFTYRSMPWGRVRNLRPPELGIKPFESQFRIQREACAAADRYIPMVVENVKFAQKWVGSARWHFGAYYLWGDVPALWPEGAPRKGLGKTWFGISHGKEFLQKRPTTTTEREAASAAAAKIPFDLARHIAACFKPVELRAESAQS